MPTTPTDRIAEATAAHAAALQQLASIRDQHAAAVADLTHAQARAAEAVITGDDADALAAVQTATHRVAALATAIGNAEEAVSRAELGISAAQDAARSATLREHVDAMETAAAEADALLAQLAPTLVRVRDHFAAACAVAPRHVMAYGGPSLYLALAARGRMVALTGADLLATPPGAYVSAGGTVADAAASAARQLRT